MSDCRCTRCGLTHDSDAAQPGPTLMQRAREVCGCNSCKPPCTPRIYGDIVTRARAALDGVTPGPWDAECGVHAIVGAETGLVAEVETDPDADFIASARTLVPELVAEVERLREALERMPDADAGGET